MQATWMWPNTVRHSITRCRLTTGEVNSAPKASPVNNTADALIDAAAAARTLLGRLLSHLEITEELAAEISSTEDALWAALFPGAAPATVGSKVGWQIDERGLGIDHIQRELPQAAPVNRTVRP